MDVNGNDFIILTNTGHDCISVLNRKSDKIIKNISITSNSGPHGITVCNSGQLIYFANSFSSSICFLNLDDWNLTDSISTGATPCHIAEGFNKLFVTNFDSDSVTVIDVIERQNIINISTGRMPHDILFHDGLIAVTESGSESLGIIDGESCTYNNRIFLKSSPLHMKKINENQVLIACTDFGREIKGYVCLVDIKNGTLIERIGIGKYLTDIVAEKDGRFFYASDAGKGCIYKISLETGMAVSNTYISGFLSTISTDPCEKNLYAVNQMDNIIYKIRKDDMEIIEKKHIGKDTAHLAFI